MNRLRLFLSLLAFSLAPTLAFAQSDDNERIDRLEHDIMLLQKQMARGETPAGATDVPVSNPAQLEVRLNAMEDEIRELRGKTEESQFQIKRLSDALDKLQKDTDFRFKDLTPKPQAAATPTEPTPTITIDSGKAGAPQPVAPTPAAAQQAQTLAAPAAAEEPLPTFASPREHYNYAFKLLNDMKYDQSAAAFETFTKKYPNDPLVGNAYYWGGETFYIRHDYTSAADHFRQGFEAAPDGPKAADNLLKLAMSLDALKRDSDACVVLKQISTKFNKKSAGVTEKAESEFKRMGCKA